MTLALNSTHSNSGTVKFLYSYGGKIAPRRTDGKLRYVGGYTRVLAVDRSIAFAELMMKFSELCGSSIILKCKLPTEDLDVLVSVTGEEDLDLVIGEYDRFSSSIHQDAKIRAVLFPFPSLKKVSSLLSPASSVDLSPIEAVPFTAAGFYPQYKKPPIYPYGVREDAVKLRYYPFGEQGAPRCMEVCSSRASLAVRVK